MRWDELVAALAGRTERRLDDRAIVIAWFDRGIVVSTFETPAVALVTLEIFLGHADHTPYALLVRGAGFPVGVPVVVGKRWLLRATLPLAGLAFATFEAMATELATAASQLAFRSAARPQPHAAMQLFGYLQ